MITCTGRESGEHAWITVYLSRKSSIMIRKAISKFTLECHKNMNFYIIPNTQVNKNLFINPILEMNRYNMRYKHINNSRER